MARESQVGAILVVLAYAALVAALTLAVRFAFPALTGRRAVLFSALPLPCLLFVGGVGAAFFVLLQKPGPEEIDAGGMAFAAIGMVTAMVSMAALVVGLAVSAAVVALTRMPR
jgi:hypothetical protein